MAQKLASVKATFIAAVVALPLGVMVFVPLWFVLAVVSRLATGQIHRVTFVVAGIAATVFMVWVFRMSFSHFRRRIEARR